MEKNVNLKQSYRQHFLIKNVNQEGKNKVQIKSPPYLHTILLFPNYPQVKDPIFHSTQYFSDNHYTLSSAPMNTD